MTRGRDPKRGAEDDLVSVLERREQPFAVPKCEVLFPSLGVIRTMSQNKSLKFPRPKKMTESNSWWLLRESEATAALTIILSWGGA